MKVIRQLREGNEAAVSVFSQSQLEKASILNHRGQFSEPQGGRVHKMLVFNCPCINIFVSVSVSGTRNAFTMIQGKNQYVLLGGFSHPIPAALCLQVGQSLWARAVGSVSSLVWDTFSKGFGATASGHPGLETWLGLLDQVLNQTLAHGFLGSEPAGPTFNYPANPCVIAQEVFSWSFLKFFLNLIYLYMHAKLFSHVWLFATLWTVARQAPLSMGFPRQEYWSGLPCPPPGDLPNPGTEPLSPAAPELQADSLPLSHRGSPYVYISMFSRGWSIY